jgi:ribosomal protein S18 acetylase RimI-like enzyme
MSRKVSKAISRFKVRTTDYERNDIKIKNSQTVTTSEFDFCFQLVRMNMNEFHQEWEEKSREMKEANTMFLLHENGFCSFQFSLDDQYVEQSKRRIPVLYLYELQIKKIYAGKGLGSKLMGMVELIARDFEMIQVTLTVAKGNTLALRFYQKRGYHYDSTCPSLYGQDVPYFILSKNVNVA